MHLLLISMIVFAYGLFMPNLTVIYNILAPFKLKWQNLNAIYTLQLKAMYHKNCEWKISPCLNSDAVISLC